MHLFLCCCFSVFFLHSFHFLSTLLLRICWGHKLKTNTTKHTKNPSFPIWWQCMMLTLSCTSVSDSELTVKLHSHQALSPKRDHVCLAGGKYRRAFNKIKDRLLHLASLTSSSTPTASGNAFSILKFLNVCVKQCSKPPADKASLRL